MPIILISCLIYILCPLSTFARPAWSDLIHEDSGAGQDHVHSSVSVTPLFHPEHCGTRPGFSEADRRIVGGARAGVGEVPWQANIARSEAGGQGLVPVCGAAVVTSRAVLTAAHCLKLQAASYRVLVGRTSLLTSECGAQVLEVRSYSLHPSFNSRTLDSDLAVVEVASEFGQGIHLTPFILPACLPSVQDPSLYRPGMMGFVSGFGIQSENATSLSSTLQTVSLPVMNHTTCEEKYQTITSIGPSQFCAGFEGRTFVKDACSGDSGGPMVVMVDGKWFLSGLVSFGMGCGRTEYPGVYTRLDVMSIWIRERLVEIEGEDRSPLSTTPTTTIRPVSREPRVLYKVSALCQGSVKLIWCDFGSEIRIVTAEYGRQARDTSTCRQNQIYFSFGDCSLSTALTDLSRSCDRQRTCRVSTDMFPNNPCQRRLPFLTFEFYCKNPLERSHHSNSDDIEVEFPG